MRKLTQEEIARVLAIVTQAPGGTSIEGPPEHIAGIVEFGNHVNVRYCFDSEIAATLHASPLYTTIYGHRIWRSRGWDLRVSIAGGAYSVKDAALLAPVLVETVAIAERLAAALSEIETTRTGGE